MRKAIRAPKWNDRDPNQRGLPEHFSRYYWDCDFDSISWRKHKEDVVLRVLMRGTWDDIEWVRDKVGDVWLRAWIIKRRGKAIDAADLRLWGLLLHIPKRMVNSWLANKARQIWDKRAER